MHIKSRRVHSAPEVLYGSKKVENDALSKLKTKKSKKDKKGFFNRAVSFRRKPLKPRTEKEEDSYRPLYKRERNDNAANLTNEDLEEARKNYAKQLKK